MKKDQDIYRMKYYDLRAKYLADLDSSWRDGYTQGLDEGAQQAQLEAQQMQQQMMEQQQQPEEEGMGGAEGVAPEDAAQNSPGRPGAEGAEEDQMTADDEAMQINGSGGLSEPLPPMEGELGKNIDMLMSMLAKGNKPKLTDLRDVVVKIDGLRKSQQDIVVDKSKAKLVSGIFEEWEKEEESAKL